MDYPTMHNGGREARAVSKPANHRGCANHRRHDRVRTLTGKEIELDIESDYKVAQIKEKVEEKEGIPPVQQRLIFGGKQM